MRKELKNFNRYEIDSEGNIYNKKTGRKLKMENIQPLLSTTKANKKWWTSGILSPKT